MASGMKKYEEIYKKNFSFGKNWRKFLSKINDKNINLAKESLKDLLNEGDLSKKSFIDVGCGSGLFSLAAKRLNSEKVISIDVDDYSIECTKYLRHSSGFSEDEWIIKEGSIIDCNFLKNIEKGDIVYSWGVLHHTGDMKKALENVSNICKKHGKIYIAIYNDFKGFPSSKLWKHIKKFYASAPSWARYFIFHLYVFKIVFFRLVKLKNPISYIKKYPENSIRGMDFFRDVEDWLGGYPYEFASPDVIINFFKKRNFNFVNKRLTKGTGCNEYVFKKN